MLVTVTVRCCGGGCHCQRCLELIVQPEQLGQAAKYGMVPGWSEKDACGGRFWRSGVRTRTPLVRVAAWVAAAEGRGTYDVETGQLWRPGHSAGASGRMGG